MGDDLVCAHYFVAQKLLPGQDPPVARGQVQLGEFCSSPVDVEKHPSHARIQQVALGSHHRLVLTTGELYSAGENTFGQLGREAKDGEADKHLLEKPLVLVTELHRKEITSVACGKHHSVVLSGDGNVYAWGRNKHGQVGNGSKIDVTKPTHVDLPRRALVIGCGTHSSMAVLEYHPPSSWPDASSADKDATTGNELYHWGAVAMRYLRDTSTPPQCPKSTGYRDVPLSIADHVKDGYEYSTGGEVKLNQQYCELLNVDEDGEAVDETELKAQLSTEENAVHKIIELKAELEKLIERVSPPGQLDAIDENLVEYTKVSLGNDAEDFAQRVLEAKKRQHALDSLLKHISEQLHELEGQGAALSRASEAEQKEKKTGKEGREQQQKVQLIQDFQDANQNSRMALLTQHGNIDKKRQAVIRDINEGERKVRSLKERVRLLAEYGSTLNAAEKADPGLHDRNVQLHDLKRCSDAIKNEETRNDRQEHDERSQHLSAEHHRNAAAQRYHRINNHYREASNVIERLVGTLDQKDKEKRTPLCGHMDEILRFGCKQRAKLNSGIVAKHQVQDMDLRPFFQNLQQPAQLPPRVRAEESSKHPPSSSNFAPPPRS